MRGFGWFKRFMQRRQRAMDCDILWRSCCTVADGNLTHARAAFRLHVALDPAWRDLSEEERDRIIEGLH